MIKKGDKNISEIYLGNKTVSEVYKGEELIWPDIIDIITEMPVVLVDNETGEKFQTTHISAFHKDKYTPIGIVVVPASHQRYTEDKCGVMALLSASLNTPDSGQSTNASMAYGFDNQDLTDLIFRGNVVACQGTMNGDIKDTIDGYSNNGYMPLMREGMSKKIESITDPGTWYYNATSNQYGYIPSPYLSDGTYNPLIGTTSMEDDPDISAILKRNCMSDIGGPINTEHLTSLSTAQPDWKTDESLTNNFGMFSPAACACWRFHTKGTNQGDWYLPACGELGYCASRYDKIVRTLELIASSFNMEVCPLNTSYYWASTKMGNILDARCISFANGCVNIGRRTYNQLVRPFTRLKLERML